MRTLFLKIFFALALLLPLAACQPPADSRPLDGSALHEVWRADVGAPVNHPSLKIGDVLLVAPIGKPLLGLDAKTGKTLWALDENVKTWERAYASDGKSFFIATQDKGFLALDPKSGKTLWKTNLGVQSQMPPFVSGGVIYVPTTFAGPGMIGDPLGKAVLFALSTEDGRALWIFETENYILQTPFRQGDVVYVAGSFSDPRIIDEGGHMRLYALNAADGSVKWTYESEDGFVKQVYATHEFVSYIAYQDFLMGVDAQTGKAAWRSDTGNWVPTLMGAGDTVYYGSANTRVHAVDIRTGESKWVYNIPEGTFNYLLGAPVLAGGDLVFLTQLGELIALDSSNGELRWKIQTPAAASRTGVSIADGWVFLGDGSGNIYAFSE
ncbi:MAG: hypothetical protein Fur002_01900 [Anaerolineales bacterium]